MGIKRQRRLFLTKSTSLASKFKFTFFAVHIVRIVVCKNEASFDIYVGILQ
jgi:hypothetical protein